MVKKRKQNNIKKWNIKGFKKNYAKATKINALTKYDTSDERITSAA
jgi:hypothetical protein